MLLLLVGGNMVSLNRTLVATFAPVKSHKLLDAISSNILNSYK